MNKIKKIFDDYIVVPGLQIDPYKLSSPSGPWIVGSFALWHYIKFSTGQEPEWQYDDIDYVVHTEEQGNYCTMVSTDLVRHKSILNFMMTYVLDCICMILMYARLVVTIKISI